MSKMQADLVGKGIRFTWYEEVPGVVDSGGLGIRLSRHKKARSFFAVLPVADVKSLHEFLGECCGGGH